MNSNTTTAPENLDVAASGEKALQSVADAMRDAASTASEHVANVQAAVSDAGPRALHAIARGTYTSAYVVSYGVVYTTVFLAQSLMLVDNPLTRGVYDGGAAARRDARTARAGHESAPDEQAYG
ncbi:MAG TPA: hypothetical protein VEH77_02295 [Roseiarcus sp.]|nr:hypothetical protein [Roseiarcus sp.]